MKIYELIQPSYMSWFFSQPWEINKLKKLFWSVSSFDNSMEFRII